MAKNKTGNKGMVNVHSQIDEETPKIFFKDKDWGGFVDNVPQGYVRQEADAIEKKMTGEGSPMTDEEKRIAEEIAKKRNRTRDEIMREQLIGTPEQWSESWELVEDGGEPVEQ